MVFSTPHPTPHSQLNEVVYVSKTDIFKNKNTPNCDFWFHSAINDDSFDPLKPFQGLQGMDLYNWNSVQYNLLRIK